ncbi:hypothetical protein B0T13DRAFT_504560 [Neurospora crassa]|nr:hypothetical protein B0T13DRAFT_504560 [Neurospora crassa]
MCRLACFFGWPVTSGGGVGYHSQVDVGRGSWGSCSDKRRPSKATVVCDCGRHSWDLDDGMRRVVPSGSQWPTETPFSLRGDHWDLDGHGSGSRRIQAKPMLHSGVELHRTSSISFSVQVLSLGLFSRQRVGLVECKIHAEKRK